MKNPRFRGIAVVLLGTLFATTAFADAGEVDKHGRCSGSAHWELDAEDEGARIEMDFEVDATKAGQHWTVKLSHNGAVFDRLGKTTDHEGEFDVDRRVTDTSETDT